MKFDYSKVEQKSLYWPNLKAGTVFRFVEDPDSLYLKLDDVRGTKEAAHVSLHYGFLYRDGKDEPVEVVDCTLVVNSFQNFTPPSN